MDQAKSATGPLSDWKTEDDYWRTNYERRPYVGSNRQYETWQPAYRYGFESSRRYPDKRWEDVEGNLRSGWDTYEHRRDLRSTWEQVKDAVRDGWDRVTGKR